MAVSQESSNSLLKVGSIWQGWPLSLSAGLVLTTLWIPALPNIIATVGCQHAFWYCAIALATTSPSTTYFRFSHQIILRSSSQLPGSSISSLPLQYIEKYWLFLLNVLLCFLPEWMLNYVQVKCSGSTMGQQGRPHLCCLQIRARHHTALQWSSGPVTACPLTGESDQLLGPKIAGWRLAFSFK